MFLFYDLQICYMKMQYFKIGLLNIQIYLPTEYETILYSF